MNPTWHAEQCERDLAGAAVLSAHGARLVAELVDLDVVYDPRVRRIVDAALGLAEPLEADLSAFDDGEGLIGPHIVAGSQVIFGTALARVVLVARETGVPVQELASWVLDLPCNPCRGCVGRIGEEIHRAARFRGGIEKLRLLGERLHNPDEFEAAFAVIEAVA